MAQLQTKQQIEALSKESGAVLILSSDNIRRERLAEKLISSFLEVSPKELPSKNAVETQDAADWSTKTLQAFSDSLQTLSLFSKKRCVIINNADRLNAALSEQFLEILKGDLCDILLIITLQKLPKTSKLFKFLSTKNRCIELPQLSPADAKKWIQKEFEARGITKCSSQLLNLITTQSQESLDEAEAIIEKLALYVSADTVTEKDFFAVFREVPDPGEFDLIDALQQKRTLDAEVLLQQLLNSGKNPFLLVAMIFKSYLQSLLIRMILDKGFSPEAAQTQLNQKSTWVFNKYLAVAKTNSALQLHRKVALILRADSKLKNRSLSPECVMGELLQSLAK